MEVWKDILGYEGIYQVSSTGKVKSLARAIMNKHGRLQNYPEKLLTPDVHKTTNCNYLRVSLSRDHIVTRFLVHRLVAEAFLSNDQNKPYINHIDNNGANNNIDNLEWCTHSENMIHAQNQGRLFSSQSLGGKLGSAKEVKAAIKNSENLVGKVVNSWKVLYCLGKQGKGKGKYYLQCLCLGCNREFRIEAGRLRRNEATSCKSCSKVR